MQGKIQCILNEGTIIQALCLTDNGRLFPINFDWQMFQHFAEAQNGELIGLEVDYDGEVVRVLNEA